jgi:hypothetical protein
MSLTPEEETQAVKAIFRIMHTFAFAAVYEAGRNSPEGYPNPMDDQQAAIIASRLREVGLVIDQTDQKWKTAQPFFDRRGQGFKIP